MKVLRLEKSTNEDKKYDVYLRDSQGRDHKISFGATGYNDYTRYFKRSRVLADLHKEAYLKRHKPTEDWTLSGILTPGFWSRWILWNQPTVRSSLENVKGRFHLS